MVESGIRNVEIETVDLPHRLPNFDEYWSLISTLGSRAALARMEDDEVVEMRRRLAPAIAKVSNADGSLTMAMITLFARGEA